MRRINKKGYEISIMLFIIWTIMLVCVLLIVSIFASSFIKQETDIRDAEARVFANRLIYSPSSISYTDSDLGRTYPGTVDIARVEKSVLERAFSYDGNEIIAAKVSLKNSAGITIKEAFYNDLWYYRWEPLIGKKGSGAVSEIVEKRHVAIYDNDELKGSGELVIQLLIPNA